MSEGTHPEDRRNGDDGSSRPADGFFLGATTTRRRRKVPGKLVILVVVVVALCVSLTVVLIQRSKAAGSPAPSTTLPPPGSGTPTTRPGTSTTQTSPPTTQSGPTVTTVPDLMSEALARRTFSRLWPRLYDDVFIDAADLPHVATRGVIRTLEADVECGCGLIARTPEPLELTAPIEAAYPLSFLAELDEPHFKLGNRPAAFVLLAVFERLSPRSPWLVSDMAGYGGSVHTLGATSYRTMHADPIPLAFPISPLFAQLAAVFESARESGHLPPGNDWDNTEMVHAQQPGNTILSLIAEHDSTRGGGVTITGWYRVVQRSRVFDTAVGNLQCAEIDGRGSDLGGSQVQPADRDEYGPTLPAGTYSEVTLVSARDVCVISAGPHTFSFNGIQGGTYRAVGKLISAT